MMYGTAKFNAWVSASGWKNGEEMKKLKIQLLTTSLLNTEKCQKKILMITLTILINTCV